MTAKQRDDLAAYAQELRSMGDYEAAAAVEQLIPTTHHDRRIRGC